MSLALVSQVVAQTGGTGNAATAPLAPVAPATATATKSLLMGGQYNSVLPTFTTGQQGALQLDSSGRLIVVVQGTPTLPADAATQTTSAAILAKITSDPSTATLQTTANAYLAALNTFFGFTNNAKSAATDSTSITAMQVIKQISASVQAAASSLASWVTGHGTAATALRVELPTDGTGVVGLNAGSALIGKAGIDQTTPGTTNLVSAGFSRHVASTPTVQNASYVSGNCIGGFNAVTVAVNNGQSGFITNFRVGSVGGATPTVTVYLFSANPSASTCTDKSTFTLNSADVDKLIALPTAATLAAPTGTTVTFGGVDYSPPKPFIAGGSTGSGVATIYYALVSGSTFTPATTTDIHTSTGVLLN